MKQTIKFTEEEIANLNKIANSKQAVSANGKPIGKSPEEKFTVYETVLRQKYKLGEGNIIFSMDYTEAEYDMPDKIERPDVNPSGEPDSIGTDQESYQEDIPFPEQEEQTTIPITTVPEEVTAIVSKSGVEKSQAFNHALAFSPFMNEVHRLSKSLATLNATNPTPDQIQIARINRLALVKIRGEAEKKKDALKQGMLAEGGLITSLNGVIANTAKLYEEQYLKIEKAAEFAEKKRIDELTAKRIPILSSLVDNVSIYPIGSMGEDAFNDLVFGLTEAKKKREADAKAKLDAEEAEREQGRIALLAAQKENERLKFLNEAKAKLRYNRAQLLKPYLVFIRDYNLLIEAEEQEFNLQFTEIKKGAELQWEADKHAQLKKQTEADAEAKRLAELNRLAKVKADADAKLLAEANRKAKEASDALLKQQAEQMAKQRAEALAKKKADSASDIEKLKTLSQTLTEFYFPVLKDEDADALLTKVKILIDKTVKFLNEGISKL